MIHENFVHYGKYYDLMYEHKDYESESIYIDGLLRRYAPGATSVIELGSGTGRHASSLAHRGYSVHGIEKSQEMLKRSFDYSRPGLSFEQGDICTFSNKEVYDIALSLFHVISYLTENDVLLTAFKNVHRHLRAGGVFVFDVWHTPAVYTQKPDVRLRQIDSEHTKITRLARPAMDFAANVVNVSYDIIVEDLQERSFFRFSEHHAMRHFGLPEISLLAEMTGFSIIRTEEFQTGKPPGPDTWGVCYVLRK